MLKVSVEAKGGLAQIRSLLTQVADQVNTACEATASRTAKAAGPLIEGAIANGSLGFRAPEGGGTPLYDTGNFAGSWVGEANGVTVEITPTGMNGAVSNADLSAMLEVGTRTNEATPHVDALTDVVAEQARVILRQESKRVRGR